MKSSERRLTQVHTRKLDRMVAHENMKKAGYTRINKGKPSAFSREWRKFINV